MNETTGRPDDYAEVFEAYIGMVRKVCARQTAKYGGGPEDVEDLAQQVMLRFIQWDGLNRYDPRKLHKTRDGFKTAKFATFLRAFVSRFAWDVRDGSERRAGETLTDFEGDFWEQRSVQASFEEEVETAVFIRSQLTGAWEELGKVRLSAAYTAADVLEVMVEHAQDHGVLISASALARRFQVGRDAAAAWKRLVMAHLEGLDWEALAAE